jgi:hypothetical protein
MSHETACALSFGYTQNRGQQDQRDAGLDSRGLPQGSILGKIAERASKKEGWITMSKKTILVLSLTSMLLGIIGTGFILVQFFAFFSQAAQNYKCQVDAGGQVNVGICQYSADPASAFTTFGWLELMLFLFAIPGLIAWIGALVRAAKMQTWGWFVVVILMGTLGTFIYALVWPSRQPVMMGYVMPYPQPYPPQYAQPYPSQYSQPYPPQDPSQPSPPQYPQQ